jgi:hypothetical protein
MEIVNYQSVGARDNVISVSVNSADFSCVTPRIIKVNCPPAPGKTVSPKPIPDPPKNHCANRGDIMNSIPDKIRLICHLYNYKSVTWWISPLIRSCYRIANEENLLDLRGHL